MYLSLSLSNIYIYTYIYIYIYTYTYMGGHLSARPRHGFGYVLLDPGYDVDPSVPNELRVESSEVRAEAAYAGKCAGLSVGSGVADGSRIGACVRHVGGTSGDAYWYLGCKGRGK